MRNNGLRTRKGKSRRIIGFQIGEIKPERGIREVGTIRMKV